MHEEWGCLCPILLVRQVHSAIRPCLDFLDLDHAGECNWPRGSPGLSIFGRATSCYTYRLHYVWLHNSPARYVVQRTHKRLVQGADAIIVWKIDFSPFLLFCFIADYKRAFLGFFPTIFGDTCVTMHLLGNKKTAGCVHKSSLVSWSASLTSKWSLSSCSNKLAIVSLQQITAGVPSSTTYLQR